MRLVARRVAPGLLLILAASVLILAGIETLPGDVAQSIPGQSATPQALANLRAEMGLDRPAAERSFARLAGAVQGDFGEALSNRQDIATAMGQRLGNTLFLAFRAAVVAVPLAILLGLIAVRYRGRRRDRLISGATLATVSVPEFLLG
jgi:peptide/nickel transport system permease protein